jgi:hypothetical protein
MRQKSTTFRAVLVGIAVICASVCSFLILRNSQKTEIRRVEVKSISGEPIKTFFQGLPKNPAYDLKTMRSFDQRSRTSCPPTKTGKMWNQMRAFLGLATVEAQPMRRREFLDKVVLTNITKTLQARSI